MKAQILALCTALTPLAAQETPRPNRVPWFELFPEPLADGQGALTLEASSQWLRPDFEQSADGRTRARLDGEEWQLMGDLPWRLGPVILSLRTRLVYRSGGIADQAMQSWHKLWGMPDANRDSRPNFQFSYRLNRDGQTIVELSQPGLHLMDTDLALLLPFGDRNQGARLGLSVQAPTGRMKDFTGNEAWDGVVGGAAWKAWGTFRLHGQAEEVFLGLPSDSALRAVIVKRNFPRAWAGIGYQGAGPGFWNGLGLDITLGYSSNPYHVGISRIDAPTWQQHWTFSHAALPHWRFGFSEEAGSYVAPDITAYVTYRF